MLIKYISAILLVIVLVIALVIGIGIATKCDHLETYEAFSFQPQNSTAMSHVKTYCESCQKVLRLSVFRGTPTDSSYLKVINNGEPVVGGKYYTVTASVNHGSYISSDNRISCVIEKDDIKVYFSVTFKEEYREMIDSLEDGDTITFYGKYSSDGFYWTDCDLIK